MSPRTAPFQNNKPLKRERRGDDRTYGQDASSVGLNVILKDYFSKTSLQSVSFWKNSINSPSNPRTNPIVKVCFGSSALFGTTDLAS